MTKTELRGLLNELGRSPTAIAKSLEAKGIRGWKGSCALCPLAVYLKSQGAPMAEVSRGDICIRNGPDAGDDIAVRPTKSVKEFIERFDDGMFPALDKAKKP